MKWSSVWPLQLSREVPSGITPLPCVALQTQILALGVVEGGRRRITPDFLAEVGLGVEAELALATLGDVEGHDVVPGRELGDALADALHDAAALVAEDNREAALRVRARQRVGVRVADAAAHHLQSHLQPRHLPLASGPWKGGLTSWALGGATVMVSMLSGAPAFHATAARHWMSCKGRQCKALFPVLLRSPCLPSPPFAELSELCTGCGVLQSG